MAEDDTMQGDDVFTIHIDRGKQGFGFNVKGTTQEGGTLQAINGRLFPPLQYISHVESGGAAYRSGLRMYDRILEVNGVDVRGASHNEVVQHIIKGGGILNLKVLRVDDAEASRLQRLEDASNEPSAVGKGGVVVKIRDFDTVPLPNGKGFYTVFNVYVNGEYKTSKRYSEFVAFHKQLKSRFPWFDFAPLPGKKLNGLTKAALHDSELRSRQSKLQAYLQKVCNAEDLFQNDLVKNFLKEGSFRPSNAGNMRPQAAKPSKNVRVIPPPASSDDEKSANSSPAKKPAAAPSSSSTSSQKQAPSQAKPAATKSDDLFAEEEDEEDDTSAAAPSQPPVPATISVLLPSFRVIEVEADTVTTVGELEQSVKDQIGLENPARKVFRLFEAAGSGKGRQSSNRPADDAFDILLQADKKIADVQGHFILKPWLFSKAYEPFLDEDEDCQKLLFENAKRNVERGWLICKPNRRKALDAAAEEEDIERYLKLARKLETYGGIMFPVCETDDADKGPNVFVTVTAERIIVQRADEYMKPSIAADDVFLFPWSTTKKVRSRDDKLGYKYENDDGEVETIVFTTPHAQFMEQCIQRAFKESKLSDKVDDDAEQFFDALE